ncbi:MAG: VanW family protein [Candidatus Levybacteria bacterium]|nr:VanW family protein [Candidatus Levybacteria bacterium]
MKIIKSLKKKHILMLSKNLFWFLVGAGLGLFLLASFAYFTFQKLYSKTIYPGIMVNDVNFGGKTKEEVQRYFLEKNKKIAETKFVFYSGEKIATISAGDLDYGYNAILLANQAFYIGRSDNTFSNISLIFQSYLNGLYLSPSYHYSVDKLEQFLYPTTKDLNIEPIDALFTFQNGKVSAFRPSIDGQRVDMEALKNELKSKTFVVLKADKPLVVNINIPIKVIKPKVTTDRVNSIGIKELIGSGTSLFQGSIPNRMYNITLAAEKLNGILLEPNETFSFNKAVGDISVFTGYKSAYVIQNGRTVLGDGGGVCQVSTTLFRAVLNAGLPVVERNAHAYRVGYYEQDSPPGFDATVYSPSVDFRFKNDTGNYILIQTVVDPDIQRLTFLFYGTKDNRQVTLSQAVITSQSPAPEALYQDDPTLPKGSVKQVDFAASGANVYFTRDVTKDGKTIISDKFFSNYRPWQAVYLRGTKE